MNWILPIHADINGCSLVSRSEERIWGTGTRADGGGAVHVSEDGVVQPQVGVGISDGTVGVFETGLHPGDQAVGARHFDLLPRKLAHAVVNVHCGCDKGAIADLDARRVEFGEELSGLHAYIGGSR